MNIQCEWNLSQQMNEELTLDDRSHALDALSSKRYLLEI